MKARITIALWAVLIIAVVAMQGSTPSSGSPATPAASPGSTRSVLVAATPQAAPDQRLELVRYIIDPGAKLPPHIHPGTQLASIVSGELTYTVVSGKIRVERAASDGTPGPVETLAAGQTTVLRPGDAVIEAETAVHFGENLGPKPVVILAATLLEADQPAAIVQPQS
jgi:quercetin dioxygenase-like cupin family protein